MVEPIGHSALGGGFEPNHPGGYRAFWVPTPNSHRGGPHKAPGGLADGCNGDEESTNHSSHVANRYVANSTKVVIQHERTGKIAYLSLCYTHVP